MLDKQKTSKLFKVYNGVAETKLNREFYEETIESGVSLSPSNLLTYYDKIPVGTKETGGDLALEAIRNLSSFSPYFVFQQDEVTKINVLRKYEKYPFTSCGAASPKSFRLLDENGNGLKHIIPFNFYKDYYLYKIYTQDGKEIPIGLGNWIFDCYSGILTFYDNLPEGISIETPPVFTFYQYTGGTGYKKETIGYEGITLPITNFPIEKNTFSTKNITTDKNLLQEISIITNQIDDDYISKYGWDGADTNEGIALDYESIIPLIYSDTKDLTKGYDESKDSEIGSNVSYKGDELVSCKEIIFNNLKESEMPLYPTKNYKEDLTYNFDLSSLSIDDTREIIGNIENNITENENYESLLFKLNPDTPIFGIDTITNEKVFTPEFLSILDLFELTTKDILIEFSAELFEDKILDLSLIKTLENFNDLNLRVFGLSFTGKFERVVNLGFDVFKYLSFENETTFATGSLVGLFEEFVIKENDTVELKAFSACHNLNTIFINKKQKLNTSLNFKILDEGFTSLKNIYVYDSIFESLTENIDSSEKDYYKKLSENPNFPVLDADYTTSNLDTTWSGKIEFINASALVNTEIKLACIKLNNLVELSLWEKDDKDVFIESKVVKFDKEIDTHVLLTSPITKTTIVIDPRTITKNLEYVFKIIPCDPYVAFFYWDSKDKRHVPFVTNDKNEFDFGFNVVSAIGKIPPSLHFKSKEVLDFSNDEIVSDYYGNRLYAKVFAAEDTLNNLSADVIIQDKKGYRLDEVIQDLYEKDPDFEGTIFLRQGTYTVKNVEFKIPACKNIRLVGEDKELVKVNVTHLNLESITETAIIQDIDFNNAYVSLANKNLKVLALKNLDISSLDIIAYENSKFFLKNLNLGILVLRDGYEALPNAVFKGDYNIRLDSINTTELINYSNKIFCKDSFMNKASFYGGETFITSSFINECLAKSFGTTFEGCDIRKFDKSIDQTQVQHLGSFLMWDENDDGELKKSYTSFVDPLLWEKDKNVISLKIDNETIILDSTGSLTTKLNASNITINPTDYTRDPTAIDPDTGKVVPVEAKNLDEALKDLYLNKADLVKGKLPLKQLPDAVAYGGLQYVGTWSFDDNSGLYPTYESINVDLSVENHVQEFQPGYFFVVNPPKTEQDKNKDDDTYSPAKEQIAIDGQVYTAGDWVIYTSKGFNLANFSIEDLVKNINDTFYFSDITSEGKFTQLTKTSEEEYTVNYGVLLGSGSEKLILKTYIGCTLNKNKILLGTLDYNSDELLNLGDTIEVLFKDSNYLLKFNSGFEFEAIFNNEELNIFGNWEKIDRAFQDAAYAILPSLDPDGKEWDWRKGGDGWLSFSKVTITEAFDRLNEHLKAILPQKSKSIKDILLDTPILQPTEVYSVDKTTNAYVKENLYLISNNQEVDYSFKTKETDCEKWKTYVYYGDNSIVTIKLNDQEIFKLELTRDTPTGIYKVITTQDYGFVEILDIHKDENSGLGFWKGLKFKLNFPQEVGTNSFVISFEGREAYEEQDTIGTRQANLRIDQEPYDLSLTELVLMTTPHVQDSSNKFYLSGVPFLHNSFISTFNINVLNIIKDYVLSNNYKDYLIIDTLKNGEITNYSSVLDSLDNVHHNASVNISFKLNAVPNTIVRDIELQNIQVFGATSSITKTFESFRINGLFKLIEKEYTESERVVSGGNINYPTYDPTTENLCGSEFNSSKSLNEENYQFELQKTVNFDYANPCVYQNPHETFKTLTGVEQVYDKSSIDSALYRWATFDKFEGQEVILNQSSGFTLNLNPVDVDLWQDTYNLDDCSLKDVKIFVKLYDKDQKSETNWLDVNKPYIFYSNPTENGDGVAYAGRSDWVKRRVTFGPNTKSGKVIVRIGLKADSDLKFNAPSIEGIA